MNSYPNYPFSEEKAALKQELSETIENFLYRFENEGHSKEVISRLLNLYQTMLLDRGRELGDQLAREVQNFVQACADYANGHGKVEKIHHYFDLIKKQLS